MKRSTPSWVLTGMALVLVAVALLWFRPVSSDVHIPSSLERATLSMPSLAPSQSSPQARCGTGHAFVPKSVTTSSVAADVLAFAPTEVVHGETIQRTPPEPPLDRLDTFAYDESGAQAGAKSGYVILTAHSYSAGWSLGNEVSNSLGKGDVLKLRAGKRVACYRVTRRVETADYPTDLYQAHKPRLVLTVCSDYDPSTRVWQKRTIWYAEPMK